MTVNRQRFALNLGLAVVAIHAVITLLFWGVMEFPDDRVAVREITTPLTIGYAVAIVKYYLDTGGKITSEEQIGVRLVILVILIFGFFFSSLVGGPIYYLNNPAMSPQSLNSFLLTIESGFGALVALIFSYLYKMEPA